MKIREDRLDLILLGLNQAVNSAAPLLLALTWVELFGMDFYGKFVYHQSYVLIIALITDWGFNLSTVRDFHNNKLNSIKGIFLAKLVLFVLGSIVISIVYAVVDGESLSFLFSLIIALNINQLFPDFLFLLKRKIGLSITNKIFVKIIPISLVMIFKSFEIFIYSTFLLALGSVILGNIYYKKYWINNDENIFTLIKTNSGLVAAAIASSFYLSFVPLLLKLMEFKYNTIGVYSVVEKIAKGCRQMGAVYVKFNFVYNAVNSSKKILRYGLFLQFLHIGLSASYLYSINNLYNTEITIIILLSTLVLIGLLNGNQANNVLIRLNKERQITRSIVISTIIGYIYLALFGGLNIIYFSFGIILIEVLNYIQFRRININAN